MMRQFTSRDVNVPLGIEFALADDDGLVIATVMWTEDRRGRLASRIYAPSEKAAQRIPPITPGLAAWYKKNVRSDVLVEYSEVNTQNTYRIDYRRAGELNSYRINLSEGQRGIVCLRPQTVYRLRSAGSHLATRNQLKALMSHEDALMITSPQARLSQEEIDQRMRVLYGLEHREIVVWNEAELQRNRHSFAR